MISTFTALIDSNVFYGARLRSLFLYLAQTGLFRARWSEDIHREWISNLLRNRPDLSEAALHTTRRLMDEAVLDCLVDGYQSLVPALALPDQKDRHVLAAAIKARASAIVTFNLEDFPQTVLDSYGIHCRHPDEFIMDLLDIDQVRCIDAIGQDIKHYFAPPLSVDSYVDGLAKAGVPETAEFLRSIKIVFG